MSKASKYDASIQFVDSKTGKIETENVYGEGFLRWAYGTPLGRLTVELAVKRLWFSRWYGWRMNRPKSAEKIAKFIRDYGVDTGEFLQEPESFKSFNEFFYRRLKPDARPIVGDDSVAVFPADGRHLIIPDVSVARSFYIKGQRFELSSFLGDPELAKKFEGGSMIISRLCPVDYHRYHFPVSGAAGKSVLLGGSLRSVSPLALRRTLSILWENRRSRTIIESKEFGEVVVMEVGATCVGGMHTTFIPETVVQKGAEKGYFSFGGSCVTTLFPAESLIVDKDLLQLSEGGLEVYAKMGQRIGICRA